MRVKAFIGVIAMFVVFSALSVAQDSYFPQRSFDGKLSQDKFLADYFTHELKFLGDMSFLELSKNSAADSYRFLWLRTFSHPVSVRLDIQADGSGVLTTKVGGGKGGYPRDTDRTIDNKSRTLTPALVEGFLTLVDRVQFWQVPSYVVGDQTGTDGSFWIVEAAHAGKYHVAARWTPDSKSSSKRAVRELGLALAIELAQMKIPASELY
jgi:hypothetical protein